MTLGMYCWRFAALLADSSLRACAAARGVLSTCTRKAATSIAGKPSSLMGRPASAAKETSRTQATIYYYLPTFSRPSPISYLGHGGAAH